MTEVSDISHVNLRAGWKELTKLINHSNSSLLYLNPLEGDCIEFNLDLDLER